MRRRSLLVAAGWLAAVAVATLIGTAAIRLVGDSITGTPGGVLSEEEVERALAAPPPSGGAATAPASPGATSPAGARRSFATAGGSVVAECVPGGVFLVSWSPAPGHRVVEVDRGPDDDAEIEFTGPGGPSELRLRCVGGQPVEEPDDD